MPRTYQIKASACRTEAQRDAVQSAFFTCARDVEYFRSEGMTYFARTRAQECRNMITAFCIRRDGRKMRRTLDTRVIPTGRHRSALGVFEPRQSARTEQTAQSQEAR